MSANKSFILHKDSLSVLNKLSDEQAGKLFKAIFDYQNQENLPQDSLTSIIFEPFLNQFKRDSEKYKITCEARKMAGSLGGKQKVANASNCKQKVANLADSDSKNKSDSDSKKDKEDISKETSSLVLLDDFDDFWKHYTPIQDKNGQHIDKGSKSAARKSYEKARKKFSHEQIMNCLEAYLRDCAKNSRFTKHASSWLNQATADGFEFEQVAVIQSQAPPRKMSKDELQEQASQEFLTRTQKNYDNEYNF